MLTLTVVMTAAYEELIPYFDELMAKLTPYLLQDGTLPRHVAAVDETLRARAIMAVGRLAHGIGKERFRPYLEPISRKVAECLKKEELLEMSQAAFSYFADIAQLLMEEFAPMLPSLVPAAINACKSSEGLTIEYRKNSEGDLGLDSDEDREQAGMGMDPAFIERKTAALHALGAFSVACPKQFKPYIEESVQALELIWNYFDEAVREQVVQTYQQFVESLNLAHYGGESHPDPVWGLPAKAKLAPEAHKLYYELVLPRYLEQVRSEDDKDVVAQIVETLADMCNCIGPAVVEERITSILEAILLLLNKKAPCMTCNSEAVEADEEDSDEVLLENLVQLLSAITKACGDSIVSQMQEIFVAVGGYLKPDKEEFDLEIGISCFGEFFKNLPSAIPSYAPTVLPLCSKYCSSGCDALTQASAYCIGVVVEKAKGLVEPFINEMLQALKSAYETSTAQSAKDNAVASILKMLVAYTAKLPLELIIPAIFQNIPLREDLEENLSVAKNLLVLSPEYYTSNPVHLENSLMTCVRTIVDDACEAEDTDKSLIGKYLLKISAMPEIEAILKKIIGNMSQAEVNTLQKFMS